MRRGEVWWATLPPPWGRRPVLLLTRDEGYGTLTWIVAAAITTTLRTGGSFVRLTPDQDGVPRPCVVNADALFAMRQEWLDERITLLRPSKILEVERAIHFALALSN